MLDYIQINTQNSIRIETARVIRFDPYCISDTPQDADLVFLTHEHYDHFSPDDLRRVLKPDTVIVAPETMRSAVRSAGFPEPFFVRAGEKYTVGGISVETVPAYNTEKPYHPKTNGWVGYILTLDGSRIYVAGDTDAIPEAFAVHCDIALIPIGGTFTMDPSEAAALVNQIRPSAVIPTHYGSIVGSRTDGIVFSQSVHPGIRVRLLL